MCLNASLAGLVAITAPCDVTDCVGAAIIGAVAGIVVLIVLIGAVRSHGRTIDLNKYLTINTSGYNGYGSVTAEVDWDSFEEKYDSKISYKKKNKYGDEVLRELEEEKQNKEEKEAAVS